MKLFIITFAFTVLLCTLDSSFIRASHGVTRDQFMMDRPDKFVQDDDETMNGPVLVKSGNVCTGNIERACNNLCKTNNNELKIQLKLKTCAYDCLCPSRIGRSKGEREPRSQCGPETTQACKEFCKLLNHNGYTCNEYGTSEQECFCD